MTSLIYAPMLLVWLCECNRPWFPQILGDFLFLFLLSGLEITKCLLVRIAKSEDLKQSDLSLRCLFRPFGKQPEFKNFGTSIVLTTEKSFPFPYPSNSWRPTWTSNAGIYAL